MRRRDRRARTGRRTAPGAWASVVVLAALTGTAISPAGHGAARFAFRLATAIKSMPAKAEPAPPIMAAGRLYDGTPAVGALVATTSSGSAGGHFCTASVVTSPHKNLAITAAHCVSRRHGVIDFVPDYQDGSAPFGVWTVSRVIVDQAWSSSASQDDDVAFLVIAPRNGMDVQQVTGADRIGFGETAGLPVQVIGYPDDRNRPITCRGRTSMPLPHQLEFDCRGYTGGTSGSPFLIKVSAATGEGTVIGVIGGYQQGGDLPQISYAAVFGPNVAALYRTAIAGADSLAEAGQGAGAGSAAPVARPTTPRAGG
jgi:V8-like Glu-specific endopeptidase